MVTQASSTRMAKLGQHACSHNKRWSVYSQKDLADAFDCEPRTIATWVSDGLPRWEAGANRHRYCITCTIQWREQQRPQLMRDKPTGDEIELGVGDSPGLERLRLAKAQIAEIELERIRGTLLPIDEVKAGLMRAGMLLRRLGERLGRRFGAEATIAVNEATDEFVRLAKGELIDADGIPNEGSTQ